MDIYSNPPPNTYRLYSVFTMPVGGGVRAIAIRSAHFPLIAAAYTILVQILFGGLWTLVSNFVLISFPLKNRVRFIGLVTFWNSHTPWTAMFSIWGYMWNVYWSRKGSMYAYLRSVFPGTSKHIGTGKDMLWGALLLLVATAFATGGLILGITYPDHLRIGTGAPVHPASVFIPYPEEAGLAEAMKDDVLQRPSILRALGSAEAFDLNTGRSSVSTKRLPIESSNPTNPQGGIEYSYNITAAEFGLQTNLDLVHKVRGSCRTEYSWLHPSSDHLLDEYRPWNGNITILVYGPKMTQVGQLGLLVETDPLSSPGQNSTFALLPIIANVASFTTSTDPWYYTESLFDLPGDWSQFSERGAGYRIKPGRPALSCWEESLFCTKGRCGHISDYISSKSTDIPKGMKVILAKRFVMPQIVDIILQSGVTSLKSYFGSVIGSLIDAASATMHADVERLVLASYLRSREAFRDAAIADRPSGVANALLDSQGNPLPGSTEFILRSGDVVTLRLDLVLLAPILSITFWVSAAIWHRYKHGDSCFANRSRALRAPHLFRLLDIAHAGLQPGGQMNSATPKVKFNRSIGPHIHFGATSDRCLSRDMDPRLFNTSEGSSMSLIHHG